MKYFYLPIIISIFLVLSGHEKAAAQKQNNFLAVAESMQKQSDYVFDLPFIEDWEYHTFTHNLWEISDDAWAIDIYNGNDGASAKFQGSSNQTNYTSTLTSNWLAGNDLYVGTVTLNFDVKLSDLMNNNTEYLYIKIFNGSSSIIIDSLSNNGSFDWSSFSYNISNLVYGNDFKLIFDAEGASSTNIMGWYIDNIEVFRECEPPRNLNGRPADFRDLCSYIEWDAPEMFIPVSPWKYWDSGNNFSAIGLTPGGDFSVAARWDANTLNDVDGDSIGKLRFFISDNQFDYLVLHVWTGTNADSVVYTDTVANFDVGMWNEHYLNTPVVIDASLEYWIGYDIINQVPNTLPASTDAGPAITGYGDMIKSNTEWQPLSNLGLSYNWNIEMFVNIPPDSGARGLSYFVLYKSVDAVNYAPIDSINYIPGQMEYNARDYDVELTWYWYKLNAVWADSGDTCISAYAKSYKMPSLDYITVDFTEGIEEETSKSPITVYPNPTTNTFTISSEVPFSKVAIYDVTGQVVYNKPVSNSKSLTVDISNLNDGIYFVKVATKSGLITRKIVKQN